MYCCQDSSSEWLGGRGAGVDMRHIKNGKIATKSITWHAYMILAVNCLH